MSVPNQTTGNEYPLGHIAGIPIRFSPWYLLLVLFVFWRASSPRAGFVMLVCITISVLLHELGHGLVAKHYGQRPSIVIHALGGYCERAHSYDRRKNFRIVFAGPAVSFGLAMLFWVFSEMLPPSAPPMLRMAVFYMATMNVFWGIFNVLPVLPMDGGRMLQLQLGYHVNQGRADTLTAWMGVLFGVAGAVAGFVWFGSLFIALFLAMMAYQNYQGTQGRSLRDAFTARPNEVPAARGGSGFELPPLLGGIAGLLLGGFFASSLGLRADNVTSVVLFPQRVLAGFDVWTPLTYPVAFTPWEWAPLLYALVALWWFGPPVWRVYASPTRFVALYGGALALGALSALALAGPLGWADRGVFGPGAASVALMVAWARFSAPAPILPGVALQPRHVAAIVLLGEAGLALSGLVDWSWHAHVAGVLPALLIPPPRYDNVIVLPSQGDQDMVH